MPSWLITIARLRGGGAGASDVSNSAQVTRSFEPALSVFQPYTRDGVRFSTLFRPAYS